MTTATSPSLRAPAIDRITRGPRDLALVPDPQPNQVWAYQIAMPFQLGPTRVALSASMRLCGTSIVDLEAGGEILVLDSLDPLMIDHRLRVVQPETFPHPRTGDSIHMSYSWMQGGFVPLGAKRDDGSPHPHAGTGFSVVCGHGYPAKLEQADTKHIDLKSDVYTKVYVQQFAFDGQRLRMTHQELLDDQFPVPGHEIFNGGFSMAIPDGDDLLFGVIVGTFANMQSAFSRWRRGSHGRWVMIDFRVVDPFGTEPTLVRDPLDGSLLLSSRPRHGPLPSRTPKAPTIFRSTDGGKTWAEVFRKDLLMANTPVTLHRGLDGALFLVTNKYHDPPPIPLAKRDQLWAWPLTDDRADVLEPVLVRDTRADWGPTRTPNSAWRVDHCFGGAVRFADGRWRYLLTYRGLEDAEMRTQAGPTDRTGCYVEEVIPRGEALPPWRF